LYDGQTAVAGNIIYRQRGNRIWAGKNVIQGKDFTLSAKIDGIVKYSKFGAGRKRVAILPAAKTTQTK
jgi:large subunit ribosomal protein L27